MSNLMVWLMLKKYAREILAKGAQNVIISMAGDGALLVTPEAALLC